ncbi:MAG TPA: biotin--[acetyl-CoA-carboxylase] ligase [Termitinemataceae bacterium]|nr:biotin--[acetyl-CoA-carboxylase] ligase [Termitinemataceae bacterium]HOM24531.1 biotin--[acetyl-CoA-carboxylase] ligase [Termitinemataceae bacterium]
MELIPLSNPFGGPVYYLRETSSTQDEARRLVAAGTPNGTVVLTDYQSAGRGRGQGRSWQAPPGENLLCTIILQYQSLTDFPPAASIRVGLAVARAIEPYVSIPVYIKWPNDVILQDKKVCGILCEGAGTALLIGIGLNIHQRDFPPELASRATSLALIQDMQTGTSSTPLALDRNSILSRILEELQQALSPDTSWQREVERRLYKRGEIVSFVPGLPDTGPAIEGILEGVSPEGALVLRSFDGIPQSFVSGEIRFSSAPL